MSLSSLLGGWSIDTDVDARTTLGRMAGFVRKAMSDSTIIYAANRVISITNSREYPSQIAAIRSYLQHYFRFVGNPLGTQTIRTPAFMLDDIKQRGFTQGACDDAAVLAATLGMANAIPARFRAVAFVHKWREGESQSAEPFTHVIADLWDGDSWEPLDVTKPFDMDRAPHIARTLTIDLS